MNKLAAIITAMVLMYLFVDFIDFNEASNIDNNLDDTYGMAEPSELSKDFLAIEKKWLDLQAEADAEAARRLAEKQKNNNKTQPVDDKNMFSIGDNNYKLLGIFVSDSTPFILVKNLTLNQAGSKTKNNIKNTIIKVKQGNEFSPGVKLTQLTSSKIILQSDNDTFEFNLFERNLNETP